MNAHVELAAGAQLDGQGDLLVGHCNHGLVDGHVAELDRQLRHGPVQAVRERLPRGHHVAGRRHQHAPVDEVVAQERVLAACVAQKTPAGFRAVFHQDAPVDGVDA